MGGASFVVAINLTAREFYLGRAGRVPAHWRTTDLTRSLVPDPVPPRYMRAYLESYMRSYRALGYRILLGAKTRYAS